MDEISVDSSDSSTNCRICKSKLRIYEIEVINTIEKRAVFFLLFFFVLIILTELKSVKIINI